MWYRKFNEGFDDTLLLRWSQPNSVWLLKIFFRLCHFTHLPLFVMVRIEAGYSGKSFLGLGMTTKNNAELMMPIRMYLYE